MDVKLIREKSAKVVKALGVIVPSNLPLSDIGRGLRPVAEIGNRLLVMHAVVASAYGFERNAAEEWLNQERLSNFLSEAERAYLVGGLGAPEQFQVRVEAIWALVWILGFVPRLDFTKRCDGRLVTMLPNLKNKESSSLFLGKARLRSLEEVLELRDIAYCLHWGIREFGLRSKKVPVHVEEYVIAERRRSLEWALCEDEWESISLDT